MCRSVGLSVRQSVGPWFRHAFIKNSLFIGFWALLPLPTRTRLMAVYQALFIDFWALLPLPTRMRLMAVYPALFVVSLHCYEGVLSVGQLVDRSHQERQ